MFLLAASRANLKLCGFLKQKQWSEKAAKILLPLAETMKCDRLTYHPLGMLQLLLPSPRRGKKHAPLSPKSVYSSLRFVGGSASFSFSNCSSPKELVSVYVNYLRPHLPKSQLKLVRGEARAHLSQLWQTSCSEVSFLFLLSLHLQWIFCGCHQLLLFAATSLHKVACSIMKHSLVPTWISFFISSIFLGLLLSFLSVWKSSSILPIRKMGKSLNLPASFRPISFTSYVSKLFEHIISSPHSHSETKFISNPAQTVYSRTHSLSFSVHFGRV